MRLKTDAARSCVEWNDVDDNTGTFNAQKRSCGEEARPAMATAICDKKIMAVTCNSTLNRGYAIQ